MDVSEKKGELRILSRWVKCLSLGESAKILFYKKQRGGKPPLFVQDWSSPADQEMVFNKKISRTNEGKHKYFFIASAEVKMVSIYLSSVLILEFRPSTS